MTSPRSVLEVQGQMGDCLHLGMAASALQMPGVRLLKGGSRGPATAPGGEVLGLQPEELIELLKIIKGPRKHYSYGLYL